MKTTSSTESKYTTTAILEATMDWSTIPSEYYFALSNQLISFLFSLKPENVLIDANGFALLTDFGLSKENMTEGNQATSLCGTPEYLAPEVLANRREYGKACDWWSFGVLLYEMISGVPPFYSRD